MCFRSGDLIRVYPASVNLSQGGKGSLSLSPVGARCLSSAERGDGLGYTPDEGLRLRSGNGPNEADDTRKHKPEIGVFSLCERLSFCSLCPSSEPDRPKQTVPHTEPGSAPLLPSLRNIEERHTKTLLSICTR